MLDALASDRELSHAVLPVQRKEREIMETFIQAAKSRVSKGAKPDRVRSSSIPRNFKGAIQVPDLKATVLWQLPPTEN